MVLYASHLIVWHFENIKLFFYFLAIAYKKITIYLRLLLIFDDFHWNLSIFIYQKLFQSSQFLENFARKIVLVVNVDTPFVYSVCCASNILHKNLRFSETHDTLRRLYIVIVALSLSVFVWVHALTSTFTLISCWQHWLCLQIRIVTSVVFLVFFLYSFRYVVL